MLSTLCSLALILVAGLASGAEDDEWVEMPAGGKPAYMGIHGGTMPVSLLVSRDGSSLYTFVGRTGNDFLEVLRKAYTPLPSFGNATRRESWLAALPTPGLFAGNATASMPVIPLVGDIFSREDWLAQLRPFGLSASPLDIEGEVSVPASPTPVKRYRLFSLPNFFQPRQAAK